MNRPSLFPDFKFLWPQNLDINKSRYDDVHGVLFVIDQKPFLSLMVQSIVEPVKFIFDSCPHLGA